MHIRVIFSTYHITYSRLESLIATHFYEIIKYANFEEKLSERKKTILL